ncbi:hypothetical protein D5H78_12925 [Vallicoccus soli]|uniref:Uncharacterized protein n=2 Tax=Vallicoccus soli TaxID=2339232 RepID=A0A3A3YVL6_9ACTN|nr:hypothetical protein D5H78_12925 [Vallicoccus soli]
MPVGDCERAFAAAAAEDEVELVRSRLPWLNQRGHLGLPVELDSVTPVLERIFLALGGVLSEQAGKRLTPLPGDFLQPQSGVLVEIDEPQHFTSYRLLTLEMYPAGVALGYDLEHYKALCRAWSARSDKYRAAKAAPAFGPAGRQRQRAYNDALRDLAAAAMSTCVVRADAPDRDGAAAYQRGRSRLRAEVGTRLP